MLVILSRAIGAFPVLFTTSFIVEGRIPIPSFRMVLVSTHYDVNLDVYSIQNVFIISVDISSDWIFRDIFCTGEEIKTDR